MPDPNPTGQARRARLVGQRAGARGVHGRLAEAARGRERLAAAVGAAGLGVLGGRGRSPAARHAGRAAERACTPRQPGRLTSRAPLLAADPRVLRLTALSFLTRWLITFGLQLSASCQVCRRETSSRPTQGMFKKSRAHGAPACEPGVDTALERADANESALRSVPCSSATSRGPAARKLSDATPWQPGQGSGPQQKPSAA